MQSNSIIKFIEAGETDEIKMQRFQTLPDMLGKHVSAALEHRGSGKPLDFAEILLEADEVQASVCRYFNIREVKRFSATYTDAMWESGKFPAFIILRIRKIIDEKIRS